MLRATTACTFPTCSLPKVNRDRQVFKLLTWKRASRQNGVHFCDISTSKSVPTLVRFLHFDLEMCFAPQRRALLGHLNFQTCSDVGVLCKFDLETCFTPQRRALLQHLFVHFDLETRFTPQRRALFRHAHFQKWSEPVRFLKF